MEGRRVLLLAASMACAITALMVGCKKGGPARPYDAKAPGTSGSLVVAVLNPDGSAVTGVVVKIIDSLGGASSQTTNFSGTASFDFDYQKYYAADPDPVFNVEIPAQGHYGDSSVTFKPKSGQNGVTFIDHPTLAVIPAPSNPATYSLDGLTYLHYPVIYDKGGNLEIPVSIVTENVPTGWTVDADHYRLDGSITQALVTITIPAGEYRNAAISILGYYANNPTTKNLAHTDVFNIRRGFPITIQTNCWVDLTNELIMWGSNGAGFTINEINGTGIPWAYDFKLINKSNSSVLVQQSGSTAQTTTSFSCSGNFASNTQLAFQLNLTNPDVGSYGVTLNAQVPALSGGLGASIKLTSAGPTTFFN